MCRVGRGGRAEEAKTRSSSGAGRGREREIDNFVILKHTSAAREHKSMFLVDALFLLGPP